jgi:hypothetical protein
MTESEKVTAITRLLRKRWPKLVARDAIELAYEILHIIDEK